MCVYMLEEFIIQIKCIYIYIINGVLEAGDLAVNLAMVYLYICRSQYIRSQLTSITSPYRFFLAR